MFLVNLPSVRLMSVAPAVVALMTCRMRPGAGMRWMAASSVSKIAMEVRIKSIAAPLVTVFLTALGNSAIHLHRLEI